MTVSSRQRVNLRRAIASSAFTLTMLVALIGLFSMFSVWSINRAWVDGTNDAARLQGLSLEAVRGQVAFKVQVQEWKNILLRGDDQALLQKHLGSFRSHGEDTRKHLTRVALESQQLGLPDRASQAVALRAAHEDISRRYEATLAEARATHPDISPIKAREMDRSLRGIDRDLERDVGLLSAALSELSRERYLALAAQMDDRYESLRWFIIGVVAVSLVITGFVLSGALRATRE